MGSPEIGSMKWKGLHCCYCASPLREDDLIPEKSLARCSVCKSVFQLESNAGVSSPRERPAVEVPKGISMRRNKSHLEIGRRWFSCSIIPLLIRSIFWNGFMIYWNVITLGSGAWIMSVFGLLPTVVGVSFAYFTMAGFINRTTIRAGGGLLSMKHHPLPSLYIEQEIEKFLKIKDREVQGEVSR